MSRALCLFALLTLAAGAARAQERVLLVQTGRDPETVELFVAAPRGKRPHPVMLFVHGHQHPERPGGRVFTRLERAPALATVDEGRLLGMRDRGYLAASVSLPGYGDTSGPSDFCGPRSQAAVRIALDHLLSLPGADAARVVVYGVSRGAITSAMVAAADARPAGVILVAGMYDVDLSYPTGDKMLDGNIEREAGTTPEAIAARSALPIAEKIRASVLILHGADDHRGGVVDQARLLSERLQAAGRPVKLRVYEKTPHRIPMDEQWKEIDPFLRRVVGR